MGDESKCYYRRNKTKHFCLCKMCVACGVLLLNEDGRCSTVESYRIRFLCRKCR